MKLQSLSGTVNVFVLFTDIKMAIKEATEGEEICREDFFPPLTTFSRNCTYSGSIILNIFHFE